MFSPLSYLEILVTWTLMALASLPCDSPFFVLACFSTKRVAKVNGSGQKIGPAILLKVMAGDKFNVSVNSWWSSGSAPGSPGSTLTDLATALANGLSNASGKFASGDFTSSGMLTSAVTSFLGTQGAPGATKPNVAFLV